MCEESDGKIHSGCTAVTAFLRVEDTKGHQSFVSRPASPSSDTSAAAVAGNNVSGHSPVESSTESVGNTPKKDKSSSTSRIKKALRSLGGGGSSKTSSPPAEAPSETSKHTNEGVTVIIPPASARYVLYSANAGDARGVLSRSGRAVRLTYDHKGTDKQEAKRIMDAGGFVMSGRVNGVLAVTRSLGDSSMKEFVVGSPYTTETELCEDDEFLILACDGVSFYVLRPSLV